MSAPSRVLIVDDDPDIRNVLKILLKNLYFVAEAVDGPSAIDYIAANPETDLVVLDVMMPGMSGYDVCDALRRFSNVPILFLTACGGEPDKLNAYTSGGDDFLSKPFSHTEFLAKVSSLLRRYTQYRGKQEALVSVDDLQVDFSKRTVTRLGAPISLTDTEYSILEHLLRNRGSTVTAAGLYEAVWREKFLPGSGNTVMVHVLNLRRKIEQEPSCPKIIRTVWGKGYQID